ncbi:hypothetical protein CC80DRAFT_152894 [Byssothecium circinans]|uniref:Uncharacterized protein n=1 Tax=Byssothecium circinans TaxID=147558 RepID=A0A6A5TM31_9PLEO|nr:hypothetical protein CC80DRAFT_152894 [Byssothecium circinans]
MMGCRTMDGSSHSFIPRPSCIHSLSTTSTPRRIQHQMRTASFYTKASKQSLTCQNARPHGCDHLVCRSLGTPHTACAEHGEHGEHDSPAKAAYECHTTGHFGAASGPPVWLWRCAKAASGTAPLPMHKSRGLQTQTAILHTHTHMCSRLAAVAVLVAMAYLSITSSSLTFLLKLCCSPHPTASHIASLVFPTPSRIYYQHVSNIECAVQRGLHPSPQIPLSHDPSFITKCNPLFTAQRVSATASPKA